MEMQLFVVFLILNVQLGHIFAFPQNPSELPARSNHEQTGYECGNTFFTDSDVKEALSLAQTSLDKGTEYPKIYQGELYSESRFKDYFLYPIRKGSLFQPQRKYPSTIFRVVFTRDSKEAIDVVARVTKGDYTKCIRRDSTYIGPSYSAQEITTDYLCGHEYITAETVSRSLDLAQKMAEEDAEFPIPYVGLLYPKDSGHLIWPITRGKNLYSYGKWNAGPIYLILDNNRQFVDVVIKGFSNNFLRCTQTKKPPKAPTSDPYSNLFVQPPKPGFFCGIFFFEDKILEAHAETIKRQGGVVIKGRPLEKYSGAPYHQPCLIWPIMNDGSLYKRGYKGLMRLVLTRDYKVLNVAMFSQYELKPCERKIITSKKNHDTSDYNCNENQLSHQKLVVAAEIACKRMSVKRNTYPAQYKGPEFKLEGPYFTYPVNRNGDVTKYAIGQHRVVINANCEFVGALTTLDDHKYRDIDGNFLMRLVNCHRISDGPTPPYFFGDEAETVFEYYLGKKYNKLIPMRPSRSTWNSQAFNLI